MDAPAIPIRIAPGDVVQATRLDETPEGQADNVTVGTFTVENIAPDGLVSGSPVLGALDPTDGWLIELVTKAPENLALPTRLSELAVWSRTNEVLHVMGKGPQWRDVNSGRLVDTDMILGWVDWEDWDAQVTAYREAALEAQADLEGLGFDE